MTSRKFFAHFFSKQSDKRLGDGQSNKEKDDDENSEHNNRTLQRSRSGRLKEIVKKRPSVAHDTFLTPTRPDDNSAKTAYLPDRELTASETARLSLSIKEFMMSPPDTSASDHLQSNEDLPGSGLVLQHDEIF